MNSNAEDSYKRGNDTQRDGGELPFGYGADAMPAVVDGHDILTETWQMIFLRAFAQCGVVRIAAETAGVRRRAIYGAIKRDPAFAQAFGEAREEAVESLEYAARQRALLSSDNLLMFLLKGARPEVYRDVVRNENINLNVNTGLERLDRELTDGQLSDILAVVEAKRAALGPGASTVPTVPTAPMLPEASEVSEAISGEVLPEDGQ